jgi:hypothetical protein
MSIKVERTKKLQKIDDIATASEDLTTSHRHMVVLGGGAANSNATVGLPSGQGVRVDAVLLNAPASGAEAQLGITGIREVQAYEAFNAGVELTVAGADGRVQAAASGDFVCGIAREASGGADHLISMITTNYYKP